MKGFYELLNNLEYCYSERERREEVSRDSTLIMYNKCQFISELFTIYIFVLKCVSQI
jgi:hypothetical protein